MRRRTRVQVDREGRRYRLGSTPEYGGIWRKRPWGWRLVSRYPLTEEGRRVACSQFDVWEPTQQTVTTTGAAQRLTTHRRSTAPWRWGIPLGIVLLLVAGGGVYLGMRETGSSSASRLSASRSPASRPVTSNPSSRSSISRPVVSTPSRSTTSPPPSGSGYLSTQADDVLFLQWNDSNGALAGTLQDVTVSGSPPDASASSNTVNVTGSLNGQTISLSFGGGPLHFGTLSGGSFTIDVPQSNGTLGGLTFVQASASSFNGAVAKLQDDISQADQSAANALALRHQENKIDSAAAAVAGDISNSGFFSSGLVQDEGSLASDVKAIPADLQSEANDLATTQSKEQKVIAEAQQYPNGNNGQVCAAASRVSASASIVAAAASSVEAAASSVQLDLSTVRSGISSLNSDFATLQSEESNLPGYQPPNAPTQQEVSQAIASANAAIASALSTTNGYINQANADVTTAYGYAADADRAGNCGTPPSLPSPQQHIS